MLCPICGKDNASSWRVDGKDVLRVNCAQCGDFHITGTVAAILQHKKSEEKFIASAYLRERQLKGLPPVTICSTESATQKQIVEGSPSVGWDAIIAQGLPGTISERLDRTLSNFSRMVAPGRWFPVLSELDWVLAFAEDYDRWEYIVGQLEEDALIERSPAGPTGTMDPPRIRLTPKG